MPPNEAIPIENVRELNRIREALKAVYATIPDTEGCMNNIHADGGCGAWCCETQNPQVLYSEFTNIWRHVNQNWDRSSVIQLIGSAVRSFLSNKFSKGCVFWDKKTKLCTTHETRPFNCRIYGITPEEEFKPRYEALKVLHPEVRNQCGLVKTVTGTPITKKQTDDWWNQLVKVETSMGVPPDKITDAQSGTYRTFHDHIMLSLYKKDVLVALTKMRLHATEEAKEAFVQQVISLLTEQEKSKQEAQEEKAPEEGPVGDSPSSGGQGDV